MKEIVRLEMGQERVSEHESEQEVQCTEKRKKMRKSKAIKSKLEVIGE